MSDKKKKISLPIASEEPQQQSGSPKSRAEGGDILSEIEKAVTENPIVLFMKGTADQPMCGFSARAAAIVSSYDKPFITVNVLADPEVRQGIKDYGNWPTIPQLYLGGELVGGSDIVSQMHASGELRGLIEEAFSEKS